MSTAGMAAPLTLGFGAELASYDDCACTGLGEHAAALRAGTHSPIPDDVGISVVLPESNSS